MKEQEYNYEIDYDMFSTMEIVKIIEFFRLIESTRVKKVNSKLLVDKYHEYQNILHNKSLEKKYDKMLQKKSNVSIWDTVKMYL